MKWTRRVARVWLPIAALSVFVCGLAFVTGQQVLRMGANDPEIQMAEDAAASLSSGTAMSPVPTSPVELSRSLAPFLIVYDDTGAVVGSSALLQGQTPRLPPGVLDYVRAHGQDRITWQPAPGVRIAAVIERVEGPSSGFVLAGRSLREVEQRESILQSLLLVSLAVTWVGTLIVISLCELLLTESGAREDPGGR